MRSDDRNAQIVKVSLEIKRLQAEKRRLLAEAAERLRPPARKRG